MKLLHLTIFSFVFISTSAFAINKLAQDSPKQDKTVKPARTVSTVSLPLLPVLKDSRSFPILSAQAALAMDVDSGVTLYEKNPDGNLLPASTTKIITALVSLDSYPLDTVVKVKSVSVSGQKMGLKVGEEITVRDLLYGLLVYSANDAAEVLAQNFPTGREAFITAMNEKAKELHLNNTHFSNPSGLEGNGHITTARDLVRVATVAMKIPFFRQVVGTKELTVNSLNGDKHKLTNINKLLGEVDGVLGVKTGWTENARENLVTYVERDGKKVMIAILGSQDRFGETEELIGWIFENYEWEKVDLHSSVSAP